MKRTMVISSLLKWSGGVVILLLIGALSACGEQQSNSASAPSDVTVVSSPTSAPPTNPQGVTVTLANNGQQIRIKVGQTILVALDDVSYAHWTITSADSTILATQPGVALPAHSQALYKALATGQTTMTAKGILRCSLDNPPCQILPQDFQIQVTVE